MHWIDPDHLPETIGLVDCFLLNTDGEADGLVLKDGIEIHFPPHMGSDVLAVIRPGSSVHVRGVRPRGVAMIAAVSIAPEEGAPIADAGPPDDDTGRKAALKHAHAKCTDMEARGVVRQLLHGPKGDIRGLLLEDGRTGRFPPHAAQDFAALLVPNASVVLRGDGLATVHGTVIAIREMGIREMGATADEMRPVEPRQPKNGPKDHKPHRPGPGQAQRSL